MMISQKKREFLPRLLLDDVNRCQFITLSFVISRADDAILLDERVFFFFFSFFPPLSPFFSPRNLDRD